jgi:DNA mismatch endonuclease (patch repair protein)
MIKKLVATICLEFIVRIQNQKKSIRRYLYNNGYMHRKNVNKLPGCPDIVLSKYKMVIFINGCFGHIHEACRNFIWPKSNIEFWKEKLTNNKNRDIRNYAILKDMGWNVIIIYECELN